MASKAGYLTEVKIGGTATLLTSEAMSTYSSVANTFRVTNAAKRVLDPATAVVFNDDSGLISAAAISKLDRLFSVVTFTSAPHGDVRVSGKYIPVSRIGGANKYALNMSMVMLDDTDFSSTGDRSRSVGLFDVQVTVSRFDPNDQVIYAKMAGRSAVLLDIQPGGPGGALYRGWFQTETNNKSEEVAAIESAELTFQMADAPGSFHTFGVGST
jgi:hypothetical protein